MQQTSEALRNWFRQIEPMCPELFNAAYAMCGNYELAEQALCGAVLELWALDAAPGMGFRERARSVLREEALSLVASAQARGADFTWPGLPEPRSNDPILRQAAQERLETQRALLLRHGCGLSVRTVAQLTGEEPDRLRTLFDRFEARCRRNFVGQNRSRVEALIPRRMQQLLTQPAPDAPSAAQIYRAFEAEAGKAQVPNRRLPRALGKALMVLLALFCGALFWLFAVLVQPAVPEPDVPRPAVTAEAPAPEGP